MKTEIVESYPDSSMSVYYDAGLGEVYQLVFHTGTGAYTRLDRMWRQLTEEDDSLHDLNYYDILPQDWRKAKDLFDEAQSENRVMNIDELKEYWAEYVDANGEFV